jgi:hypothetical protein
MRSKDAEIRRQGSIRFRLSFLAIVYLSHSHTYTFPFQDDNQKLRTVRENKSYAIDEMESLSTATVAKIFNFFADLNP